MAILNHSNWDTVQYSLKPLKLGYPPDEAIGKI